MESINLNSIEKKIWFANFQDGLWDIYWGILLLGFGLSPIMEDIGIIKPLNFAFFPVFAFLILILGKKFITVPRTGMIKFGEKRKSDQKKLVILGIIAFIISIFLLFLVKSKFLGEGGKNTMSGFMPPVYYAIIFTTAISIIAYFMEYKRLYIYAFLFGLSIPIAETLYFFVGEPWDGLIAFSTCSLPILITGISLLLRFIKSYKPLDQEVNNAR